MVEETEQLIEDATAEPKETPAIDSKYRKIILAKCAPIDAGSD